VVPFIFGNIQAIGWGDGLAGQFYLNGEKEKVVSVTPPARRMKKEAGGNRSGGRTRFSPAFLNRGGFNSGGVILSRQHFGGKVPAATEKGISHIRPPEYYVMT